TIDAIIQVNRMSTIVPLRTFSSMMLLLYPTIITASVAAAWALLKPNIKLRWLVEYLNVNCVAVAARNLPNTATTVSVPATIKAVGPFDNTLISTIIPTDIRKKGIKIALPINSILFIKAEECGISLFKANPAANAPMIGSSPAISAIKAEKNTTVKTKI